MSPHGPRSGLPERPGSRRLRHQSPCRDAGNHGGVHVYQPVAQFPVLLGQGSEFSVHSFHVLEQKFVCDGFGHGVNMLLLRRAIKGGDHFD